MKKLKYEIPGLVLLASFLFLSNEIGENGIRYGAAGIAVLGIAVLAYLITRDITEGVSTSMTKRDNELQIMLQELKKAIEKYSDEQCNNTNQLVSVIDKFSDATSQYMEKVDALVKIQNLIVEEEKILNGEVKKLNSDVHKMLDNFCTQINDSLNQTILSINSFYQNEDELLKATIASLEKQNDNHEISLERIITSGLENANKKELDNLSLIRTAIEEYMSKYETVINEAQDSLNALKSQVKVSLDSVNKAIQEQTSAVEDGFEDCVDEIGEKLEAFSKDQKNRDNEQNAKLNEEIKTIEQVVSDQVGQALGANERLLVYIQKVQAEWTSLSRDEIAFLEKVWNE